MDTPNRDQLTVFCDIGFLEGFWLREPFRKSASEYTDEDRAWSEVFDYLRRSAALVIDLPRDSSGEVLERYPFLRPLLDAVGPGSVRFDAPAFEGVGTADYHRRPEDTLRAYFVERDGLDVQEATERTLAWFADSETVFESWGRLGRRRPFVPTGRDGVGGNAASASDLVGIWRPSGAAVVTDKYLFADERGVRESLVPLLLAFLPDAPHEVRFDLALVGHHGESKAWSGDPNRVRKGVLELLERKRPFLTVDLTVAQVKRWTPDLHDRRIFLSYQYVESGVSFKEYFKGGSEGAKSRLTPSPLTDPTTLGTFRYELADIAELVTTPGLAYVAGNRRNKLFGLSPPSGPL